MPLSPTLSPRLPTTATIVYCVVLALLVSASVIDALRSNPYRILGVKRSDSQEAIKRAFKSLAKKWHPDKSDHTDAAQRFAEIRKAYENLSDANLKKYFDRNGHYKADANQAHNHASSSWSFRFDPDVSSIATLLTSYNFDFLVRDSVASSSRIWIIKVYSSRCRLCETISSKWEDAITDLNGIVHVGRINYDETGDLVRELGIRSLPSIILASAGSRQGSSRILHFKHISGSSDVSLSKLQTFISGSFRDDLVHINSMKAAMSFLSSAQTASTKVKVLFVSTVWKRPPLLLRRFVHVFVNDVGGVDFAFVSRSSEHIKHIISDDRPIRSEVVVLRETGFPKFLDVSYFEDILEHDPESLRDILSQHRQLYMPHLDHESYYDVCLIGPIEICFVVFTEKPNLFWSVASNMMSEGLEDLLDRPSISLGWTSPSNEREYARFIGADIILRRQSFAIAAVSAASNKYSLYLSKLDSRHILEWMQEVAQGEVDMVDALPKGGLPFLAVPHRNQYVDGILEWFSSGSKFDGLRHFRDLIWSWISPLLTGLLYSLLIAGAFWMLMFAPNVQ